MKLSGIMRIGVFLIALVITQSSVARADHCGGYTAKEEKKQSSHSAATPMAEDAEDMKYGLAPGSPAPLFKAAADSGITYDLEKEIKQGPVVLVFYRGGWCPYCSKHLNELKKALPDIEKRGATLAAISVDRVEKALETQEKQEVGFPLLSDPDAEIVKKYRLAFTLDEATLGKYETYGINIEDASGRTHHQIAVPAVYIIGVQGRIEWAYLNEDYKVRAENEMIIAALDELKKSASEE